MQDSTPDGPVVFSGSLSQNKKEEKQYTSSISGLKVHKYGIILHVGKPMKKLKLYFSM
jgi:hypothetical protein